LSTGGEEAAGDVPGASVGLGDQSGQRFEGFGLLALIVGQALLDGFEKASRSG